MHQVVADRLVKVEERLKEHGAKVVSREAATEYAQRFVNHP